jgi:U3 small nucleolar RNA-associated protein 6
MAEFVQKNIEEMLPELDCLRKIGLFTLEETREVLKKRKRYEYKMQRRTKEKEVYLQYIQYEKCVFDLIKKRRENRSIDDYEEEIEKQIILRIYKLFRIACFRFKSDIKLWLTYIDFVKKQMDRPRVSKIFTALLQIHNKKPNLWIMAAKFEFEINESPEIARQLFQRAIRFLPESKKLWLEYFRMELLCVELILKRKQALGIDDNEMKVDEKRVEDAILNCKVAEIIVKNSIKSIHDPYILQSFVQIAKDFNFTDRLIEYIYKLLSDNVDLMCKEEVWDIMAKKSLLDEANIMRKCNETGQIGDFSIAELEQETNRVYLEAIDKLNTSKMWSIYLEFCFERFNLESQYLNEERFTRLNDALNKAKHKIDLTLEQCIQWIDALTKHSNMTQVLEILEWSLAKYPLSADLWKLKLKSTIDLEKSDNEITDIFNRALKNIAEKESVELWSLMIKWARQVNTNDVLIEDLFRNGSLKSRIEVAVPLRVQYLDWAFTKNGKKKVREVYESLKQMPPFSLEFFMKFIELESCNAKISNQIICSTYEEAIGHFGSKNDDLWMNYIRYEHKTNKHDPQGVYQIYWKALKQLDENLIEDFTQKFNSFKINLINDVEIND